MKIHKKSILPPSAALLAGDIYLTLDVGKDGNPIPITEGRGIGGLVINVVTAAGEIISTMPTSEVLFNCTRAADDALSAANIPQMIQDALQALPPSSSSLYYGTISERDAVVTPHANGTFCLVADATEDATVTAGAALYFYVNDGLIASWVKVAEYESMDAQVTIPNLAIVEQLGESGNQLTYKGSLVGGISIINNEW